MGWSIGTVQSGVFGSKKKKKKKKRRHRKEQSQIEGWFHCPKAKPLATGFATQRPELGNSTRIFFKTTQIEDWLEVNKPYTLSPVNLLFSTKESPSSRDYNPEIEIHCYVSLYKGFVLFTRFNQRFGVIEVVYNTGEFNFL